MAEIRLYSKTTVTDPNSKFVMLTDASDDYKISQVNLRTYMFATLGGLAQVATLAGSQAISNKTMASSNIYNGGTFNSFAATSASLASPAITTPTFNGSLCQSNGTQIDTAVGLVAYSGVTAAQIGYLAGLDGNIQNQLDTRLIQGVSSNYCVTYGAIVGPYGAGTTSYAITGDSIVAASGYSTASVNMSALAVQVQSYKIDAGTGERQLIANATQDVYFSVDGSGTGATVNTITVKGLPQERQWQLVYNYRLI